jgi:membrane associated rhomboid family serine protease
MMPIRDVIPSRTTPWITVALGALLIVVFGWTMTLAPEELMALQLQYGFTPAAPSPATLVASNLIHVSWLALLSNVIVIGVLGETVEDRVGSARMAVLLGISVLAGGLAVVALYRSSPYPLVGAASAAGAVIGAHLALFRRGRVLVRLPFAGDAAELPALFLVAAWFLLQAAALGPYDVAVAGRSLFVLQTAGAACGGLLAWLLRRRERLSPDWWSPLGRASLD